MRQMMLIMKDSNFWKSTGLYLIWIQLMDIVFRLPVVYYMCVLKKDIIYNPDYLPL